MTAPPAPVDLAELRARLRQKLNTDTGMAEFLDKLIGAGNWTYDRDEDVWVTPDKSHSGPGRGFLIVKRGGDWFKAILPNEVVS